MPLLLCDLDDTLLDRAGTFRTWADRFVRGRGLDPAHVEWLVEHDLQGYRPRPELFALARERLGLTDDVDDLVTAFYREFNPLFRCDEEVRAALARARGAGWKVAIVTNGSPAQEHKVVAAGLADLVDAWCISSVEGCRKPDVRLLEVAAARCGEPLASAWLVGDDADADVAAAHAAGIPSVWLRAGRRWPHRHFAPTLEADSFGQAVDLVLRRARPSAAG